MPYIINNLRLLADIDWFGVHTTHGTTISNTRDFWLTASALITEFSMWAIIIAIGVIIYGGYLYISAAGDEGKISTATKTVVGSIVGLIIFFSVRIVLIYIVNTFS